MVNVKNPGGGLSVKSELWRRNNGFIIGNVYIMDDMDKDVWV